MSAINLDYASVIGEKLRAARQHQQMSLRELAKRANISASMLSQIETGKAYPSVRSIYTIAETLDLPIDYFFPEKDDISSTEAEDSHTTHEMTASEMREAMLNSTVDTAVNDTMPLSSVMAHVLHASARPTIQLKGGVSWSRLTGAAESDVEFLEIAYARGATSGANLSHHEGREFGLILEGELEVQLGFEQVILRAGDSIVFDSTTPHRLANKSSQPMRALWVVWTRA
jgi:transcriptional regulator with XRE-family HTH domain